MYTEAIQAEERVVAEIDLAAIRANLSAIHARLGDRTPVMAIIKADAYGHGAVRVAHAIDDLVAAYGVAVAEEALELREAGIKKPILILGYVEPCRYRELVRNHISPAIFSYEAAAALSEAAVLERREATLHLAVDTGMTRIGFHPTDESIAVIRRIAALPGLYIEGMFTHFACADMADKTSARRQHDLFVDFCGRVSHAGICVPIYHCSNSAGIMEFDDAHMDMVRAGIILYGLYPSDEVDQSVLKLEPALSLRARITHVQHVPAGTGISYGSTFVTARDSVIATVPVGYADGWPRALSNKGRVLVRGQFAPIVGRVCMDQFMIDVTDIPGVHPGDVATLIGKDGANEIPIEEPAALAGSFQYELPCVLSKRIPRRYLER
ncbi:MAG: alanine racemase [Butyricicoccus sp.]